MSNAEKLAEIDALLATVPSFPCKPGCADCCGPIHYSRLEFYRCVKASGRSLEQVREQIKKNVARGDHRCPFLDRKSNQCSIYAVRPAICRIFGSTSQLRCPHGYGPKVEDMLSEERSREILAKVKELGA